MSEDKPALGGHKFTVPVKKYGLIIPNKSSGPKNQSALKTPVVKPCIFDEEDDEDIEDQKKAAPIQAKFTPFNSSTSQTRLKKQTQIEIEKALTEDPSVFEYDSIYDDMEKEKVKAEIAKKSKSESKEPKYIVGIMKAAAKRQMEYEKIQERKIQKEREEEGDLWADKEVFVTAAYRQRIEERERLEAEERNQDAVEALLDVRKQKDLSGFYSNLLKMKTGELVVEEEGEKEKRIRKEEEAAARKAKKGYRVKKTEESSDEEVAEPMKIETVADVEFVKAEVKNEETETKNEEPEAKKVKLEQVKSEEIKVEEIKKEEENVIVPKLSKEERRALLFNKRTVGETFDKEVAEFFERKSNVLVKKSYVEREN